MLKTIEFLIHASFIALPLSSHMPISWAAMNGIIITATIWFIIQTISGQEQN